jgi:hypothetical protein
VSRDDWSAELAEKEADWRVRYERGDTGWTPAFGHPRQEQTEHPSLGGNMEEQALYKAIAPDLEHTDEAHARDMIRIVRAVLLARDRELARELRLHPGRHH